MTTQYLLIGILVMALMTYLIRVLPMAIFRKKIKNRFIQSFLSSFVSYDFSCNFFGDRNNSECSGGLCGCHHTGIFPERSVGCGFGSFSGGVAGSADGILKTDKMDNMHKTVAKYRK